MEDKIRRFLQSNIFWKTCDQHKLKIVESRCKRKPCDLCGRPTAVMVSNLLRDEERGRCFLWRQAWFDEGSLLNFMAIVLCRSCYMVVGAMAEDYSREGFLQFAGLPLPKELLDLVSSYLFTVVYKCPLCPPD